MTTKVLNLYAGIGGNRKLWDKVEDIDVTAIEWDEDKAQVYRDHFPNDDVTVTDAHEYLLENFADYDFIWASPPCPTHSKMRKIDTTGREQNDPVFPDMKLYQEILFLQGYFEGDWVVENVDPWYEPLIDGSKVGRHIFWSNYVINDFSHKTPSIQSHDLGKFVDAYGIDPRGYGMNKTKAEKALRNCVYPELGKHVFASRGKQATLF